MHQILTIHTVEPTEPMVPSGVQKEPIETPLMSTIEMLA